MNTEKIKQELGKKAAQLIQEGMYVGIGTGSTVYYFIQELGKRCRQGENNIKAIASSKASEKLAKEAGITLVDKACEASLDITVDGADAVSKNKSLIKGGGGALLREKILAKSAAEFVVIVDETKCCDTLNNYLWPVEVLPFACPITINAINTLGLHGSLRKDPNTNELYFTDNNNYIYDIKPGPELLDYETLHAKLLNIAGVLETGFFTPFATKILVGRSDLTTYEMS